MFITHFSFPICISHMICITLQCVSIVDIDKCNDICKIIHSCLITRKLTLSYEIVVDVGSS